MANRMWTQFRYSLEKAPVDVFITLTGAGASAPTLNSWTGTAVATAGSGGYKGVKSVTRNGVGDYTITFQDTYNRLLGFDFVPLSIDGATASAAANCWIKAVSPTATGGATVRFVTYGATPGTPVEATTNDRLYICATWSNSNAQ